LNTAELGSHIVFIGSFEHHHELVLTNPALAKHSSYIGFQDDILAVLELCDLYANPRRTGGGTSAAEAMFKGKPVVTYNYGDVAVGTGPEFWVQSSNELIERVERFIREKEYYQAMSEKARARAEILMDTQREFRRLLLEIENSPYFH
jgi:glycosyltransferase involved in cell wall biosynthesis